MSRLILHRKSQLGIKMPIPYCVVINGKVVGVTRLDRVQIEMPQGAYNISVKYVFPIWRWEFSLSSSKDIIIKDNETVEMEFFHKEILWDILFEIDLLLWIAEFFFELPYPWNIVYKVFSNGFFLLWILRIFIIRERYFTFKVKYS